MKIRLWIWVLCAAALGLLVPAAFLLRWKITGYGFGDLEVTFWPSSIFLMGLEGNHNVSTIITVFAIALTANVILYAIVGLLTWSVLRFVLRRMRSASLR
jgi:hypothetical protein